MIGVGFPQMLRKTDAGSGGCELQRAGRRVRLGQRGGVGVYPETAAAAYPIADNTFNNVSYGSVTTTRLRVVMQSGQGSVGVIQWIVDSAGS